MIFVKLDCSKTGAGGGSCRIAAAVSCHTQANPLLNCNDSKILACDSCNCRK